MGTWAKTVSREDPGAGGGMGDEDRQQLAHAGTE